MNLVRASAWTSTMWTLAILIVPPATAGTHALPPAEHKSLQAFADANKDCGEWSDGCAVCLRHADGSFACSLPGVACQPDELACRAPSKETPAKATGAH